MDNGRLAEEILALVLPANRAASAVGDFMEVASGNRNFWLRVIGTFLASLWNQFAEGPFTLLFLVMRGFILSVLAAWSGLAVAFLSLVPLAILVALKIPANGWLGETSRIAACLVALAVQFLGQFQTGRWVARRAAGKEVAVALGLCLPQLTVFREIGIPMQTPLAALFRIHQPDFHPTVLVILVCKVAYVVAICAGAVAVRLELRGATAA